eukprot:5944696-Pleurochrysis_carterae.AAC.1
MSGIAAHARMQAGHARMQACQCVFARRARALQHARAHASARLLLSLARTRLCSQEEELHAVQQAMQVSTHCAPCVLRFRAASAHPCAPSFVW